MSALTLYIGNTNILELRSLTNSVTSAADTGATVTATLVDAGDDEVSNGSDGWPVTLSHVADGTYRATLTEDLNVTQGRQYIAKITAIGSSSEVGYWEVPVRPRTRTS